MAEEGEVSEKVVRQELLNETFTTVRTVGTAPGIRHLIAGPVSAAYRLLKKPNGAEQDGPKRSGPA